MKRTFAFLFAGSATLLAPLVAHAQSVDPVPPSPIFSQACANLVTVAQPSEEGGRDSAATYPISRHRLAEAVLAQNRVLPSDLDFLTTAPREELASVASPTNQQRLREMSWPPADLPARLHVLRLLDNPERIPGLESNPALREAISRLRASMTIIELSLLSGSVSEARLGGTKPAQPPWLFAPGEPGWTVSCKAPTIFVPVLNVLGAPAEKQLIAFREKPEELAIDGKARKEAGAFGLALTKVWKDKDDGTRVEETALKVNGTAGVRLTPRSSELTAYAFVQYNLNRVRTDPAAPLAPGKRRDENDTNVLALGLVGDYFLDTEAAGSVWISGHGAYLQDFADENERVRLSLRASPGLNLDLGLCNLGSARIFDRNQTFGARCLVRGESEVGLWTKNGLSVTRSYDDFLAIGGSGSLEMYYNTGEKSALLGSLTYRYLPVLTGQLRDIKRFEAALKQRFWTDHGIGVDIGFDYKVGTNLLSLKDEKTLGFSFGIIR